eukprot:CAMPEP_0117557028 /NCGR_PEP_ID=MMETSP0784-20121206/52115_1 /TAXON_ID=39447 /ORGANISM="" /LENGTH=137 /DNA_ID=CAMNT_0005354325 /DNA_START=188 /DNA_END=602 /DNA_ORIENTATION=-
MTQGLPRLQLFDDRAEDFEVVFAQVDTICLEAQILLGLLVAAHGAMLVCGAAHLHSADAVRRSGEHKPAPMTPLSAVPDLADGYIVELLLFAGETPQFVRIDYLGGRTAAGARHRRAAGRHGSAQAALVPSYGEARA